MMQRHSLTTGSQPGDSRLSQLGGKKACWNVESDNVSMLAERSEMPHDFNVHALTTRCMLQLVRNILEGGREGRREGGRDGGREALITHTLWILEQTLITSHQLIVWAYWANYWNLQGSNSVTMVSLLVSKVSQSQQYSQNLRRPFPHIFPYQEGN